MANEYLGHFYMLSGQVVEGNQIGRTIGYPTANIAIQEKHKLIPADGIYAVRILHNDLIYKGMLYIGSRTTLGDDLQKTIEVNIFDFDKQIYGEHLSIELVALLRKEMKFNSIEEMKEQLDKDKKEAIYQLAKIGG
jgi:riboflavin kinase/FMN adenylyltransferase